MKRPNFSEAVEAIVREDSRYDEQAYHFVCKALDFTIKLMKKPPEGPGRHVRGKELLEGARRYALQEYGPLAYRVLNTWGVHQCADFGQIVFNLVQRGVFGKTDEDKLEDFADGYDFTEAFLKPFQPRSPLNTAKAPAVKGAT